MTFRHRSICFNTSPVYYISCDTVNCIKSFKKLQLIISKNKQITETEDKLPSSLGKEQWGTNSRELEVSATFRSNVALSVHKTASSWWSPLIATLQIIRLVKYRKQLGTMNMNGILVCYSSLLLRWYSSEKSYPAALDQLLDWFSISRQSIVGWASTDL